jgi:flagellar M-ring protein FliF
VAAELDFARNETTSERYDPEEPVLRSEHIQQEPAVEAGSGVDDPLESSPAAGGTGYRPSLTTSSKFDYEISKTTSKTIQPMGIIEQISVTVLVADQKSIEPDGRVSFKPRTDAELDSINSLVTSALSLKPNRGDSILLLRTPTTEMFGAVVPEEDSVFYDMLNLFPVGGITMIVFVFILFYLLIIKPVIGILRTELDQQAQIIEAQRQEAFSDSETAREREDIAMVLKNEIENNPVAAAHVIKKWIQET